MTSLFSRMGLAALTALAVLSGRAEAADQVAYGPPAAWVDHPAAPDTPVGGDGQAIKTLLDDNQARLGPDGDELFNRRVIKVLKPEGLSSLTSESFTWDPAIETLTLHALEIHRGGQVIDLLKDRDKVLTLRRETGLEEGLLDGRLTATRQIDGLQVGDIVDYSWTVSRHDPVAQGHSEDFEGISGGVTGRYRVRISWPTTDPVHWRATVGFGEPKITTAGGRTTLYWQADEVTIPDAPLGAPARYAAIGRLYASSFGRWEDVSALISPLFDKAATLEPGSPLKAEAAAIAARSSDPKVRAFEALRLVESKVRYFYIGTDDGGYVPAAADETWRRRFGDCKGKTVLLLALLRELGVEAAPALVSTTSGDGMNDQLPGLGWFNHVIIRAVIGGQVYWLDGTRSSDVGGIETQEPPAWRWALPLRSAGAALEPIVQSPPAHPQLAVDVRLDARKGLDAPAAAEIRIRLTGDTAVAMRNATAQASREDLRRLTVRAFTSNMSWIDIKDVNWTDHPDENAFEVVLTGVADMDWRENHDLSVREFRFPNTTSGAKAFTPRDSGFETDAPYAVPYPVYLEAKIAVELPNGGAGFSMARVNTDATIGGFAIKRSFDMQGDTAVFSASVRTVTSEIPAAAAMAANKEMRRLDDTEAYIRAPASPAAKPGA